MASLGTMVVNITGNANQLNNTLNGVQKRVSGLS